MIAATVGANKAPSTVVAMSAASTTGRGGERGNAPISSARLFRACQ